MPLTSLPGSPQRPDILTHIYFNSTHLANTPDSSKGPEYCFFRENTVVVPHVLNILGKIPVISTFSGTGRSLAGLCHAIAHFAAMIFSKGHRKEHGEETLVGFKNFLRGLVEIVPVAGNLTMAIFDRVRIAKFQQQALKMIKEDPGFFEKKVTTFGNGKTIVAQESDWRSDGSGGLTLQIAKYLLQRAHVRDTLDAHQRMQQQLFATPQEPNTPPPAPIDPVDAALPPPYFPPEMRPAAQAYGFC